MNIKQTLRSQVTNVKLQSHRKNDESKTYNSLRPLVREGRKKLGDFATFDIETNNWKEFVIGGVYDGVSFTTHRTIESLCERLMELEETKIFAHFGGIFDFLFLLNYWGTDNIITSDLLLRGSSIFSFTIGSNVFYDSSGIIPFSLDKAAKAFNVDHKKLEIDHSIHKTVTPELIKYLKHDCVALYEIIESFYDAPILSGANFKATLASQSLEVLRKYLKVSIPSLNNKSHDDFVRQAYAGGRVEIFKPIYEGKTPLYYYDFNSLYPSVMREMQVPGRVTKISRNITPMSFVQCEVETPKNCYLPVLWRKANNKFFFPTGRFSGIFPGVELIEAIKQGYKIHNVTKSIEFENLGNIFKEYIDDLYNIKQFATDPTQKQIAKLLLNAGYGRMAIKRERETLCIDDGTDGITPLDIHIGNFRLGKKKTYFRGFSNSAIGAMVTAHARIKLFRAMEPIKNKIYYCDTDSIVTTEKIAHSTELGKLKLEGQADRACFLLPKTYVFGNDVKMKGFPKEFAQSLNFQDFKIAMEGDLALMKTAMPGKLARIKSAKNNNGSILKVTKDSIRQLRSKYDKRILYQENGDWFSRPQDISNI